MARKSKFKYDIGYQFYHYEIIDRISKKDKRGHVYSEYILKCLKCGEITIRRAQYINQETRCKGCIKNMEYHRFNVGDIVNGLQILEKQRQVRSNGKTQRAYLCKCIVDGYTSIHSEDNLLKNKGCPVCADTIIVRGINDIHTVAPWLGDLLVNKEDGYICGIGSHRKIKFKCPHCGTITRPMAVYNVYNAKHLACRKCGDGVSMPEKIMYGILEQLNINFEYQKQFDWSCGKFYDFYISDFNMIIETHGLQHYRKDNAAWDSLDSIQANDSLKKEIAMTNNIQSYVIIDCSNTSPLSLIQAYERVLSQYFNLKDLDFNTIILNSSRSFCIRAGDLWNQGNRDVYSIANIIRMHHGTVRKYLKILTKIGYLNTEYPIKI